MSDNEQNKLEEGIENILGAIIVIVIVAYVWPSLFEFLVLFIMLYFANKIIKIFK